MRLAFQTTQEQWLMALSVLSSMEDAAVRPNAISFNSVTQMQKALGREPDAMVNMRHISGIYHQYVINMSSICHQYVINMAVSQTRPKALHWSIESFPVKDTPSILGLCTIFRHHMVNICIALLVGYENC